MELEELRKQLMEEEKNQLEYSNQHKIKDFIYKGGIEFVFKIVFVIGLVTSFSLFYEVEADFMDIIGLILGCAYCVALFGSILSLIIYTINERLFLRKFENESSIINRRIYKIKEEIRELTKGDKFVSPNKTSITKSILKEEKSVKVEPLKVVGTIKEISKPIENTDKIFLYPFNIKEKQKKITETTISTEKQIIAQEKRKVLSVDLSNKLPQSSIRPKQDYLELQEKRNEIGMVGERIAMIFEKNRLSSLGIDYDVVRHISLENDAAGYDILSADITGEPIFIEVKATILNDKTPFTLSELEMYLFKTQKNYFVYRVHDVDIKAETGTTFIIDKRVMIENYFKITPVQFKFSPTTE